MRPVWRKYVNASRAGGKDFAHRVHLHSFWSAFLGLRPGGSVEEDPPFAQRDVFANGISHPDGVPCVGVGDVERSLVRGESNPVRSRKLFGQQRQFAVRRQPVNAAEVELPARVVESPRKAEGRVGEVKISIGLENQVVWAVQALAL